MKRKFRFVTLLALCVALIVPTTAALAAGFEPADPSYTTTNGADGKEVIPVYGYIGQDTEIIDPDPEEPEIPPETQVYVEVPVKVLFAAFESDKGAITSPDYTLTNLSTVNDIQVEIANFRQKDAADLAGKLTLDITDHAGAELVAGVFPAEYSSAKLLKDKLSKKVDGSTDNQLGFKIGGVWSGTFNSELHPSFEMTLQFSVAQPAEV